MVEATARCSIQGKHQQEPYDPTAKKRAAGNEPNRGLEPLYAWNKMAAAVRHTKGNTSLETSRNGGATAFRRIHVDLPSTARGQGKL